MITSLQYNMLIVALMILPSSNRQHISKVWDWHIIFGPGPAVTNHYVFTNILQINLGLLLP